MVEVLRNRPLLVLAIALVIGLAAPEYPLLITLVLLLAILLNGGRTWIAIAIGFVVGAWLSPNVPEYGIEKSRYVQSPAKVVSAPRLFADGIGYILEIQGNRLSAFEKRGADRSLGDSLYVKGVVRPLAEGSEKNQLAKGIVGRFQPYEVQVIGLGPTWARWGLGLRSAFVSFTGRSMSPERAVVLDALCFNVEGTLDKRFEDNLRSTGTIHIISASGLHVLVLAWAISGLLSLLPIPRPAQIVLLVTTLTLYAAATGFQPAIIRSVIMALAAQSAYLWRREGDILSALALSSIVYLLWQPFGIYNIGFQFSFLTVGAFGLFGVFRDSFPTTAPAYIKTWMMDALSTSSLAYLATLPLMAFYFGAASFVAIPANLVIVFPAMFLVAAGMGVFAIDFLSPSIGAALAKLILDPIVGFLQWILELFGNLTISTTPVPYLSGLMVAAIYFCMGVLFVRERVRPA